MFRRALNRAVLGAGALLVAWGMPPASAAPSPFSWNPNGATPPLSNAPVFTADRFTLGNFAHIHIASSGAFTETGFLKIKGFQLGATDLTSPGLNGTGGATPYEIYFVFSGSGTINNWSGCTGGGFCSGVFSSLTYTMYGDAGHANFSFSGLTPVISPPGARIMLAFGSLNGSCASCSNFVSLKFSSGGGVVLTAAVSATFSQEPPSQAAFFVAPLLTLNVEDAFTNTPGVSTRAPCGPGCVDILINNGGGDADLFGGP